jgi:putative heme-binding domain-containing protein
VTNDGMITTGFVVSESAESVRIRQNNGVSVELQRRDIDQRRQLATSMMPQGLVGNLTPEELADLLAYLESLH